MKKSLLIMSFLLFVLASNSQNYVESKVLDKFFLGFQGEKNLVDDLDYDYRDGWFVYDGKDLIKGINLQGYVRKGHACNLEIILVNDLLYQVTYYPLRDKDVVKYKEFLNNKYSRDWKNSDGLEAWANKTVTITYNVTKDFKEYFTHYSNKMLSDYPHYKDYKR